MTEHIRPQAAFLREVYSQRDNPAYKAELAKRTAVRNAAFLLPHLRPGMRLLDVGSGPGTISLGLAEAVAPGEVVGIDIEPAQVEEARIAATERGVTNVRFEVGDAYRLPFADHAFDAVFAHTVLMHLREPVRALAGMRRVLCPGGIIGVRDPDVGAGFSVPATPLQDQRRALQLRVLQQYGGDFNLGRHHRRLLLEAGFVRAEATASTESAGSLEATRRRGAIAKIRLQGFAKIGLAEGWVSEATVEAMLADIDAWAERPDAFYVTTWCEAVGWRETNLAGGEASTLNDRIEGVPKAVADEVQAEQSRRQRQAGGNHETRVRLDGVDALCDHGSPARHGRLYAQAEEAEPRFCDDEHRNEQSRHDNDGSRNVGHQVGSHDVMVRGSDAPGGQYKLAVPQGQYLPACDAGDIQPANQRERQDDRRHPTCVVIEPMQPDQRAVADCRQVGCEECLEQDDEQEKRDREHDVHEAHEQEVKGAPKISGGEPNRDPNGEHYTGARQPHAHRHPGTEHEAAQNVTAQRVRARPVGPTGRPVSGKQVLPIVAVGSGQGRADRRQHHDRKKGRSHHGHPMPRKPSECPAPGAAVCRPAERFRPGPRRLQ